MSIVYENLVIHANYQIMFSNELRAIGISVLHVYISSNVRCRVLMLEHKQELAMNLPTEAVVLRAIG